MKFDIMDHTGHSTEVYDKADPEALAAAMERFNQLVAEGRTPVLRTTPSQGAVLKKFDPTANEVLFIPRLVGG